MDFDPKHDLSLNLPLSFPGDDDGSEPAETAARQPPRQQTQRQSSVLHFRADGKATESTPPPPTFTVYIRVPGPRNGFVDPPDIDWSSEKDDALWKILSGMSKNDIDWQDLAQQFNATVEFLIVQATILTERQVSQVRAQTRRVTSLGARDTPVNSPLLPPGERPPSVAARAATPTLASEAMGRTLSKNGMSRKLSAEAMRRTPSGGGANTNTVARVSNFGSRGGSRRPSMAMEGSATGGFLPASSAKLAANPIDGRFARVRSRFAAMSIDSTRAPTDEQPAAEASSTPGRPNAIRHHNKYDSEDVDVLSPAATSSQASSDSESDSSTPSQPVMSRIFKRPPGYPQQDDFDAHGSTDTARAGVRTTGRYGAAVGLGIASPDSAGSDGGDESETQPAFLPFKTPTLAATVTGRPANRVKRAPSPSSSSASASPTTKTFKSPAVATTGTRAIVQPGVASASVATTASSPAAAARLHPSRLPLMRASPSTLHHNRNLSAGPSPGSRRRSGYSREGSETGTTPSMGSSFSDLDDEALASRVEDTSSVQSDAQSSSTMASSSTMSRRLR
ncbi:multidomain presynaptic cytomatrix related protein [Grosmannia clavigera kw1407]|uniref:Autophagy-related protein 29 n=1 Tax=Grosmannia clavigera (strain kw1407 / UAMH 11150) TaxID=655863 RepID=F0XB64_GROCL|nr:multidomain presynaptic cytomatrix related protein [Grosmannia clavigera kw1407]EFX04953.1 multidomain presynaptic cytomatrix related protein [Grosmannia clavigera kw1407]